MAGKLLPGDESKVQPSRPILENCLASSPLGHIYEQADTVWNFSIQICLSTLPEMYHPFKVFWVTEHRDQLIPWLCYVEVGAYSITTILHV